MYRYPLSLIHVHVRILIVVLGFALLFGPAVSHANDGLLPSPPDPAVVEQGAQSVDPDSVDLGPVDDDPVGHDPAAAGTVADGLVTVDEAPIVWTADHETGNLSQWSAGDHRRTDWDSGRCERPRDGVSDAVAHSGRYAMAMTIDTRRGASSCRQYRYVEAMSGDPYYYSAWFYLPKQVRVERFWSLFGFKSASDPDEDSDQFWNLDLKNDPATGALRVVLAWDDPTRGPRPSDGRDEQLWTQDLMDVPIGRWFHLEAYLRQSGDYDGQIVVWQDGVELFNLDGVRTRFDRNDQRWTVGNYGRDLNPRKATLYIDDAVISTERIGPKDKPNAPKTATPAGAAPTATTTRVIPPTVTTTRVVPPTATSTRAVPPTATATRVVPPTATATRVVPPTATATRVVPSTATATRVVAPTSAPTGPPTPTPASPPADAVVWSADHETGNLAQWNLNDSRETKQDSGACIRPATGVSTERARSGRYAMKLTIDTRQGESGCRQFRYPEVMSGKPYYYSAWLMIPEPTTVSDYWNVFQFKSKNNPDDGSDPFWVLDLRNSGAGGALAVMLRWKGMVAGPFAGSGTARQTWTQTIKNVPIGQWFHLEVYLRQSGSAYDGQISVWQDGVELFNFDQVKTRYDRMDQRWSVNNYSSALSPSPTTLYVDDAVISNRRIGPGAP